MKPTENRSCTIGFDARENWLSFSQLWDTNRKELYLVKANVKKPLSVDMNVWPTILDAGGIVPVSAYDNDLAEFHGVPLSDEFQPNSPLFVDVYELENTLSGEWPFANKPLMIVAITYFYDSDTQPSKSWPNVGTVSEQIQPEWEFLGYDVADAGLLSGLLNCGYSPEEKRVANERWSQSLNEHHLFDDIGAAMSFREWTDNRVTEHAPFSIYGLHVVRHFTSPDSVPTGKKKRTTKGQN